MMTVTRTACLLIISGLFTLASGLLLIHYAAAWGFIDLPEDRKIHRIPTPRTGGIAMVLGATLAVLACRALGWMPWPELPWQTMSAGAGFLLLGGLDDRFSFHPRGKFWVMLALSALAAWPWLLAFSAGGAMVDLGPLGTGVHVPPSLAYLLLTLWFMALPNAVNIEDAINGYMGCFTLLMVLAAILAGVQGWLLAGALIGFLALNFPSGRHFMGDAGSFGCGFIIAELLLRAGAAQRPIPALILTAPISMDVAMGIVRRRRLGMGLFEADRSTLPHRLVECFNGSHALATFALAAIATIFALLRNHLGLALVWAALYAALLIWRNLDSIASVRSGTR